jgi:hypothetical protein
VTKVLLLLLLLREQLFLLVPQQRCAQVQEFGNELDQPVLLAVLQPTAASSSTGAGARAASQGTSFRFGPADTSTVRSGDESAGAVLLFAKALTRDIERASIEFSTELGYRMTDGARCDAVSTAPSARYRSRGIGLGRYGIRSVGDEHRLGVN